MADELKVKQRRFGRKVDIGIQRRKNVAETESSIFKQLEEEDLQRFTAIDTNGNDVRNANQGKICNGVNGKELKKELSRQFEKVKKNSGRNELVRSKGQRIGRFLQKRLGSRVNKRWHSDSELLDSTSKGASAASGKSKVDVNLEHMRNKSNYKQDTVIPQSSKGHQKKVRNDHKQVKCDEPSEKVKLALTSLKDVNSGSFNDKQMGMRHGEVCNWMNCSFPATMKEEEKRKDICAYGGLNSDHSGVLNLLIEYFKDLNKEVREFREEKKKTREQLQDLELKVEKLITRLEAQNELTTNQKSKETQNGKQCKAESMTEDIGDEGGKAPQGKEKHIIARDESVCMEIEARPEVRQEIRNILSDVHDKYHKQLVEHEKRMKCVQEKAEFDIQKLMKTIIENYVELSHLRGTGKELGKLIDEGMMSSDDIQSSSRKGGKTRKNEQKVEQASKAVECPNENARMIETSQLGTFNQSSTGFSGRTRAEMVQNSYQFYFPRQSRDDCKSLQCKEDALRKMDTNTQRKNEHHGDQNETKGESNEGKTTASAKERSVSESYQEGTENLEKAKASDSNIPDDLGASYLEWKKYWRDKLMKRHTFLKVKWEKKEAENDEDDSDDNENDAEDERETCSRNVT